MTLTRTLRNLSTLAAAALALSAGPLSAAQAAPAPGAAQFGSVDITKIQTQSTKKTQYDTELHALADRLDTQFKQQTASPMLSKAEQDELGTLLAKTNQSTVDQARITALQAQSTKDATELTDLQQKKDATPADNVRVDVLTKQFQAGRQILSDIGDQYQAQLKALSDKDNAQFTQDVRAAIASVAQSRGLAVVFTSDVAVYTANDITDAVVARLNK